MEKTAQSLLLLAFGLLGLSFLAASWRLGCAEAYFMAGSLALLPGLGCLILSAIGWQCAEAEAPGASRSRISR